MTDPYCDVAAVYSHTSRRLSLVVMFHLRGWKVIILKIFVLDPEPGPGDEGYDDYVEQTKHF